MQGELFEWIIWKYLFTLLWVARGDWAAHGPKCTGVPVLKLRTIQRWI